MRGRQAFRFVLLNCLLLGGAAGVAAADDEGTQGAEDSTDVYYVDFSVPDLTAFGLLGVNPNEVTKPANPKEFAAGILSLVGATGELQSGIAIDWAPLQSLGSQSLDEYRRTKLLRRLQGSLATVKEGKATRAALGVRWVPVDASDPLVNRRLTARIAEDLEILDNVPYAAEKRRGFLARVNKVLSGIDERLVVAAVTDSLNPDIRRFIPPEPLTADIALLRVYDGMRKSGVDTSRLSSTQLDSLETLARDYVRIVELQRADASFRAADGANRNAWVREVERLIQRERDEFKRKSWNAALVQVAVGTTWKSADSSWDGLKSEQLAAFVGAALPVFDWGQLILQARSTDDYQQEAETDWTLGFGSRLLVGSSDFHWSMEGGFVRANSDRPEIDHTSRLLTTGLEVRLSSDAWLEFSIGGRFPDAEDARSEILSIGSLKYGISREARLDPIEQR